MSSIADRYGAQPQRLRLAAILFFTALIGFVVWAGWHYAMTPIRTQIVSFSATETSMTVRYQVTRRDSSQVTICRVSAQNYQRRVVGEISDEIPAGLAVLTRTVTVPTLTQAAAGFVGPCSVK